MFPFSDLFDFLFLTLWAGSIFKDIPDLCDSSVWCTLIGVVVGIVDTGMVVTIVVCYLRFKGGASFLDRCLGTMNLSRKESVAMLRRFMTWREISVPE